jgi:predicted small metal-binding protein
MIALLSFSCRETGYDCDYVIKGGTEEELLEMGAEHAIKVHGLRAEDIFFKKIPCNFLCHSLSKLSE